MTLTEKQAWAALAVTILLGAYFVANMTFGLTIPDQSARHLWRTWLFLLGAGVVADILIGVWVARLRKAGAIEDERDASIIARADRIGMVTAFVAINVMVWQALWQVTLHGNHKPVGAILRASPDMTHLPTLIFLLMGILLVSQLVKQAAIIVLGRL
jgi:hypothetical protein